MFDLENLVNDFFNIGEKCYEAFNNPKFKEKLKEKYINAIRKELDNGRPSILYVRESWYTDPCIRTSRMKESSYEVYRSGKNGVCVRGQYEGIGQSTPLEDYSFEFVCELYHGLKSTDDCFVYA